MTEALVIYSCMLCNKYFLTYAWEGTRVMHEKLWKIINYTKKYWIVIEKRLNYLAIDHG